MNARFLHIRRAGKATNVYVLSPFAATGKRDASGNKTVVFWMLWSDVCYVIGAIFYLFYALSSVVAANER
jgi:predicted membrane channel-forming protein YqfA (hemolysin III family)